MAGSCTCGSVFTISTTVVRAIIALLPAVILGTADVTALVAATVTVVLAIAVITAILPFGCYFLAIFLAAFSFITFFKINFNTSFIIEDFINKIQCI